MEKLIAGDNTTDQCMMGMGTNAIVRGILFGPFGYLAGAAIGYYLNF